MLDGITLLDTGTKVVSYTWGWSWGWIYRSNIRNISFCYIYFMCD